MVIDQRVDEVVANRMLVDARRMLCSGASSGAPATAVGNTAELLDVHVHQLARSLPFIPTRGLPSSADQFASERIAVCQLRRVMPPQDRADRPRRDAQLGADPVWPTSLLAPHLEHARLELG